MKKLYYLAICQLFIANCFAQGFNWQWARNATASANPQSQQSVFTVASNPVAGAYVCGYFTDTVTFGPYRLLADSPGSFFLARYDLGGNVKWAKCAGRAVNNHAESQAHAVTCDNAGNVYITGTYWADSLYFDNIGVGASIFSTFTAKYDTAGNAVWAHSIPGTYCWGITADLNNNIYVSGEYNPQVSNLPDALPGLAGILLVKYDSAGNLLWDAGTGSRRAYDFGKSVTTDAAGNVYVTGNFAEDTLSVGDTIIINRNGYTKLFTLKFDGSGNFKWITTVGDSTLYSDGEAIAADGQGGIYVTGLFEYGTLYLPNLTLHGQYSGSMLLIKYDSLGNLIWAKSTFGGDYQAGYGIATDINNNIYATGAFQADVGVDSMYLDSTILVQLPPYANPVYLLKLNSAGAVLNKQAIASGAGTDETGVYVDRGGNGYLTGTYNVSGMLIGNDTLGYASLSGTTFVAKFTAFNACNLAPPAVTASNNTICNNDSVQICAPAGYATYMWNNSDTLMCFYTSQAGNYYLQVTDSNGCTATSDSVALIVKTSPQVSFAWDSLRNAGDIGYIQDSVNADWDFPCYPAYFLMMGGTPPGGHYSGGGISGDTLYAQQYLEQSGLGDVIDTLIYTVADTNGCSSSTTVYLQLFICEGITETAAALSATVYPNPSNGKWQLATSNNLTGAAFEVWDVAGNVVFKSAIKNQKSEIQIPGIAAGVYLLRINSNNGLVVRKLIKM